MTIFLRAPSGHRGMRNHSGNHSNGASRFRTAVPNFFAELGDRALTLTKRRLSVETISPDMAEILSCFNGLPWLPLWFPQINSLPTDSGPILLPCSRSSAVARGLRAAPVPTAATAPPRQVMQGARDPTRGER